MLCNDLAGAQLSALSSVLILLEASAGFSVLECKLLFISVAINIARRKHVVMMGSFPRALDVSEALFVTCYFKSHIYKEKKQIVAAGQQCLSYQQQIYHR